MNKSKAIRRICLNAIMLALFCIFGMFSIPLGDNIKVSLQLLIVFIICLMMESVVDCLIITSLYLFLGLFLPFYAGFSVGFTPTFGYVISFVVISPIVFFLNKVPNIYPPVRMFIACFVGLLICYTIGTLFMMLYLKWNLVATLTVSVLPYIPFDIAKIIIAISVVLILPKRLIKDRGLYQYGKKKPVVEKLRKIAPAEEQEVSYLNHRLSVTAMVGIAKQPRGGFINPSTMEKIVFESTGALSEEENVHPTLIGLAVDYLSRFMLGDSKDSAFEISLKGAELLNHSTRPGAYLLTIKGLDDESIVAAIKLVSYDCVFRAGPQAYVDQSQIKPTKETINNIREMVNRTIEFWKKYGPVTVFGPTFEGGYTNSIATGDGDYLSKDTIWDYKVSKGAPTSKHTLQLLLYYLLGMHSIHEEYKEIKYLGIYNPRLNIAYRYQLDNLSKDTIETIEKGIIGY